MAVRGRGWPRWIGGAIGGVMGDGDAFLDVCRGREIACDGINRPRQSSSPFRLKSTQIKVKGNEGALTS